MHYYRNIHFARSAQHLSFPAWAVHRIKSSAGWHRRGACQHIQRAVLFFGEAQAASMGVDVGCLFPVAPRIRCLFQKLPTVVGRTRGLKILDPLVGKISMNFFVSVRAVGAHCLPLLPIDCLFHHTEASLATAHQKYAQ
jgi:hypothetical protein